MRARRQAESRTTARICRRAATWPTRSTRGLFISIHVNYSDSPSVNGTTFYWYKPAGSTVRASASNTASSRWPERATTVRDHENFYVIRHTTMPAVLIETGVHLEPARRGAACGRRRSCKTWRQGIANGVKAYAGAPPVAGVAGRSVIGGLRLGSGRPDRSRRAARRRHRRRRRVLRRSGARAVRRAHRRRSARLADRESGLARRARRRRGRDGLQYVVRGREPARLAADALPSAGPRSHRQRAPARSPPRPSAASRSSPPPRPCAVTPTRRRSPPSRRTSTSSKIAAPALVPLVEARPRRSPRSARCGARRRRRVPGRRRCRSFTAARIIRCSTRTSRRRCRASRASIRRASRPARSPPSVCRRRRRDALRHQR